MISFKYANKFCCEDISLIENYKQAVNDKTQTWDCHHRLEIDLSLSADELKDRNLYYDRPASELIFLTHSEHTKLHTQGEKNPMFGKNCEDYMSEEAIKERRKKISEKTKGENNPFYGNHSHVGEKNPMFGKNCEDYMSEEAIKEKRQKHSNAMTKRKWMNNGITRVFLKTQEEIEHYRSLGYDFGKKLK